MHEHSPPQPIHVAKVAAILCRSKKILTATNAARRVHTRIATYRIATYLGGCERSSFHDSTKFNAFTGFGFLWFDR